MLYGVVGKLWGIWWRFSVYFACFAPSPTLVFVNARNRHNVITLERIGNMVQVFAGIPPRHVCVCICFLFMKAWFKVLYFGVERYFFMCSLMVVLSRCLFCISLHTGADTANMFGGGWSDEGEEKSHENHGGKAKHIF